MKVEEAKEKWCPYMAGVNEANENCIAEKCMAWRWICLGEGYCGRVRGERE